VEIRASMHQDAAGRWIAQVADHPDLMASGASSERCLASLRRAVVRAGLAPRRRSEPFEVVIQILPVLAGVAEAAEVMGWDKRRVVTYIDRGRFPEPVQTLASGRVWLRADVEAFAAQWRAAHMARIRGAAGRPRRGTGTSRPSRG
jgi:hypothetical protein